jgi:hypothetical protein
MAIGRRSGRTFTFLNALFGFGKHGITSSRHSRTVIKLR